MPLTRSDNVNVNRDQRGFTLIEIAIVVAIIGLLASIGGSRYGVFLERARTARAIVELRGIAAEIEPMGDENWIPPNSLMEAGLWRIDPWGNPYQYLLLQGNLPPGIASTTSSLPAVSAPPSGGGGETAIALARKDRFLVPINSDFDLYSMGPDGETRAQLNATSSRDDVIRAMSGGFYGIAERF